MSHFLVRRFALFLTVLFLGIINHCALELAFGLDEESKCAREQPSPSRQDQSGGSHSHGMPCNWTQGLTVSRGNILEACGNQLEFLCVSFLPDSRVWRAAAVSQADRLCQNERIIPPNLRLLSSLDVAPNAPPPHFS